MPNYGFRPGALTASVTRRQLGRIAAGSGACASASFHQLAESVYLIKLGVRIAATADCKIYL